MATRLKFPRGSTNYLLLSWVRDGAALDLTGATLEAWLKPTPEDADDGDDVVELSHTAVDAVAGITLLKFTAANTSALNRAGDRYWRAQATLADGDVIVPETHHGPLVLTPLAYLANRWGEAVDLPVDGVSATLEPSGTVTLLPPAMANYVLNRYDLTGLTGGAATDLDGLSTATLAALQNGAQVELFFSSDIALRYRLRDVDGDTETAPWLIICDNDTDRVWQLIQVTKDGLPCTYNSTTQKWYSVWSVGSDGAATVSADETGFTIPA